MRKFDADYNQLIAEYTAAYGSLTLPIIQEIEKRLKDGYSPKDSVALAFRGSGYSVSNENALIEVLYKAAAVGFGVDPQDIANPQAIKGKLLHEAWAADKMSLSTRLHGRDGVIQNEVANIIQLQLKKQYELGEAYKNATDGLNSVNKLAETAAETGTTSLSRQLFDGYDSGIKTLLEAELPHYLKRVDESARRVAEGDRSAVVDFNKAIARAKANIEDLAQNHAPTGALKAAYENLLTAAGKAIKELDTKALDNAVHSAIQEKSRYYADRIARTELSAAWGDAFFAKNLDDPATLAFGWRLSSNHNLYDICDFHANADLYGLGKGNYPKDRFPRYPAHPHCRCHIIRITRGMIAMDKQDELARLSGATFSGDSGKTFIEGLSDKDRKNLLGVNGAEAFTRGADWQSQMINWQGHSNPAGRFKAEDFVEKNKESSIIKLAGDYSDAYKGKLMDAAAILNDYGFIPKEHSLNRIVGRIAQGRLADMESIISVAMSGNKYKTASGTIAKYDNGMSVHFNDKGEIVTVVPRKKVPSTWELIQSDQSS